MDLSKNKNKNKKEHYKEKQKDKIVGFREVREHVKSMF